MKEDDIVRKAARRAVAETSNKSSATKTLEGFAMADLYLWRALTEKYLPRACIEAIKSVTQKPRKVAWKGEQQSTSARLKESAKTLALYSFKLPSGKILGDASHYDLQVAGKAFERQANALQDQKSQASRNSLWMYALAGRMRGSKSTGKIVRSVLSEKDLEMIRNKF